MIALMSAVIIIIVILYNNLFLVEREIHVNMRLRALQARFTFSAAKVPAAFEDKIRIPVRWSSMSDYGAVSYVSPS